MTTYGGPIILQCSACSGQIRHLVLTSGNTFGARYWTDGWCEAPMLPDQPDLVKCPHCHALVWLDEMAEVGYIDWFADDSPEFPMAENYSEPDCAGLLAYLVATADLSKEKEISARMRAWWRGNDARRDAKSPAALSDGERDNLVSLIGLLGSADDNDRLLKAEAMRQLGEFQAAQALLKESFSQEMQRAVEVISNLTEKQVSPVAELRF